MSYNKKGSLIKELECVGYLIAMFFFLFNSVYSSLLDLFLCVSCTSRAARCRDFEVGACNI